MSISILFGCSFCCCCCCVYQFSSPSTSSSSLFTERLYGLFQSEFYYSIRTDFADIHCRTVRADGNCVWILEIAPMIDNLFGIWVDGESSDWNLWWRWTIHSVDKVFCEMEFRNGVLSYGSDNNFGIYSIYHMHPQRTLVRDLVLESLRLVFLRRESFSGQPC